LARAQQELVQAIEDKKRSVQASPTRNVAPSAPAAAVRGQVAEALATTQPERAEGATVSGSAGIVGVGLEQGCRDRQFSELSRFWELESGSSCPTFGLRSFHPTTASVAVGDRVDRQPQSANPINSVTTPFDYQRREMRLSLSVRTKLASGLFTPAGGTLRDSLWAAYTQQSYWQVFNSGLSRPFRSTDHLPELIYVYPTTLQLPAGWLWRYSGLGLAHQSNGQSDPLSRSWNRAYLMAGFEKGERFNAQVRLWQRLPEHGAQDNNPDISRYIGRGDLTLAWNVNAQNTLRATYTGAEPLGAAGMDALAGQRLGQQLLGPAPVRGRLQRLRRQPAGLQLPPHGVLDRVEPGGLLMPVKLAACPPCRAASSSACCCSR
jgi:phospholipase A1